jgi:hypothetical protein
VPVLVAETYRCVVGSFLELIRQWRVTFKTCVQSIRTYHKTYTFIQFFHNIYSFFSLIDILRASGRWLKILVIIEIGFWEDTPSFLKRLSDSATQVRYLEKA